jgi:hypothetical protein
MTISEIAIIIIVISFVISRIALIYIALKNDEKHVDN